MKRLLPLITILLFTFTSFANNHILTDSLKKDSVKKDTVKKILLKAPVTFTTGKPIAVSETKTSNKQEKKVKTSAKESISVQQSSLTSSFPTGNDAGRTVGSLDVSGSGAATYSLPIAVPPGINGVVAQVSLNYNSQGGNGIAGHGWNIGGLSSISRIPTTMFHDGVIGTVNSDMNDKYALDGQRLILKSGAYGANGAEYQTENYSNLKIVSRGTTGTGPTHFDVYYPDGSHAVYGQDANSNTNNTFAINYIDNPQGVRINYVYLKTNGVISISEIQYGSPGTFGTSGRIQFLYDSRLRKEQSYIAGQEIYQSLILGKIVVISDGNYYRRYNLTHDIVQDLNYERLTSVQEVSGDQSKSFEPIIFDYSSTSSTISLSPYLLTIGGVSNNNSKVLTADFTGNGKTDFLLYPYSKDQISLGLDQSGGSAYPQTIYPISVDPFEDIFAVTTLDDNNRLFSGQGFTFVKKTGTSTLKFTTVTPDIVIPIRFQSEKVWDNVPLKPTFYSQCSGTSVPGDRVPLEYFNGDFNGDGLTDVLAINLPYTYDAYDRLDPELGCIIEHADETTSMVNFINLDRRVTSNYITQVGTLSQALNGAGKVYTGDFNGNGKTDLVQITAGIMYVYELDTNNNLALLFQKSDSQIVTNYPPFLGDYNGDGKTDIMFPTTYSSPNNNIFAVFTSSGKAFIKDTKTYPFKYEIGGWDGNTDSKLLIIPNDMNGDGKTDILISNSYTHNNSTSGYADIYVYNNMGAANVSTAPDFQLSAVKSEYLHLAHDPIPLFLSNTKEPNFNLEYALLSDNTMNLFQHEKDLRKETGITKITQDGIVLDVDYKELAPGTWSGDIHLYDNIQHSQIYPYVDIQTAPGLHVVSSLKRTYDSKELYQYFGYRGAVTHTGGLGFLGFTNTIKTNWHTGSGDQNRLFTTTIFDPLLRSAPLRSFVSKTTFATTNPIINKAGTTPDITLNSAVTSAQTVIAANSITLKPGFIANGANGTFIAKLDDPATGINDGANNNLSDYITRTDYSYKTELQTNKVYINTPTAVITKDLLNKTNTIVTSTYDTYYNVKTQTSNFSGAGTKTVEYEYDDDPGNGFIGRLRKKKETATHGGDTFSTEEQYNAYSNFLPTEIKKKGNGTPFITENYTYDTYGNVTSKQLVTADGTRTTSMTYDASGRFVNTSTDIEGLVTTMLYNTVTGNVTSKTNPYGQTTTYDYDAWGRPTVTTNYLFHTSSRAYNKSGSDIEIVETDDEGRSKTTITNALGKTRYVIAKDVLGQDVGKEYQYDIYDRQIKESEPGIGSYSQWNETEYDEYSRPKKITSFTGKIADISYNGLITTINDGTKTTVTTKNGLGNVISIQDPGGTINNTYFANGNLKSADFAGSTQTIEQDGWGRKTKLTDPSAGIYTYTYNQFGETLTETTPKGTTTYTYNNSTGKLQTKQITGDNTNMAYGYTYNGTTKLLEHTQLTNGDGNTTSYTYTYDNATKLLTGTTEDNLHAVFTKTLTYDGYGRVLTEQSDAKNKRNNVTVSKRIKNYYDHGELKEITDDVLGNSIWKVTALNARGQVLTALLGNNLRETNVYNSNGYAENFKTENITATPVTLMELGFVFDQTRGNLLSRTNSAFSWSENFTYDNQDRLITYNDNTGSHSQTYDNRGRITNNSQVGDYSYTNASYQQSKVTNLTPFSKYHYQNRTPQQISYNAFKKPVSINEEGKERIDYQYNGAEQRAHMYYGSTDADKLNRPKQRHYSEDGSMEITEDFTTGETSFVFYLGGDAYDAPAIWKHKHTSSTSTGALYYLHRDYLGSILLITDATGVVQEKRHFDAWGNIIKLQNGSGTDLTAFLIIDRGYTGHEHLLGVGLINMNGRLYDPILHRFLSPDNYVQDPSNTQNFNRYGYVLNNPLKYNDPNGEFIFSLFLGPIGAILDAACWGAVIGGAGYTASVAFSPGGFSNWNAGQFWKSVGIGAISGAATFGIGQAFGPVSSFGNEALRAGAHGVSNGLISEFTGGNFGSGFLSGALGSGAGSGFMSTIGGSTVGTYAFSGLAGGVGSWLSGGDFWQGAAIGVMTAGLNHLQQGISYSIKAKGRELNPDNVVLKNRALRNEVKTLFEELTDAYSMKTDRLDFKVTGGDRYKGADGRTYSSTTGKVFKKSGAAHLRGQAVDLRIKEYTGELFPLKFLEPVVNYRTNLIFDPKALPSVYPDQHYHLQLPRTH